jgi:hypothetical protein
VQAYPLQLRYHYQADKRAETNKTKRIRAMKKAMNILFAFVWAVVMLTGVQAQAETIKTRIGDGHGG